MADIGIGALSYVGYSKESTEGQAVAPTKFLAVNSVDFPSENAFITPLQIRNARDIVVAMPAPYSTSGNMEMDLCVSDIAMLLQSAFAATSGTSAYSGGGYTHILTPAAVSPTFTFEVSTPGDELMMRYSGVRVNTLQIKATFGEIVTATFGLDGIDRAKYTGSAASPSYAANSVYPFHFMGAKVQIGGSDSADVTDFTFNVNNNITRIGTLRRTRSYRRVALGSREMGLQMSLDFQDATEYDRLLNDTEFAVQLSLYGPTGIGAGGTSYTSLVIDLPRCKYKTVGVPLAAGDLVKQDVDCVILKPSAAVIATVTLSNTEATPFT